MYVLDADASVVAISGLLHQEQEWNGQTVLRPIAYGRKVFNDTELKYRAPRAEIFAVVTFVEKTERIWAVSRLNYGSTTVRSLGSKRTQ